MLPDTHENIGFFTLFIGGSLFVVNDFYKIGEPFFSILLLISYIFMFIGICYILDWFAAMVIARIAQFQNSIYQPVSDLIDKISQLNPHQIRLLDNMERTVNDQIND